MFKHLTSVGLAVLLVTTFAVGSLPVGTQATYVPPEGILFCWPALQWAPSGQEIVFTAGYDYGPGYDLHLLSWSAPGGSPSRGTGAAFETTYWSSYERTRYVTVTDGTQTATCEVRVQPSETPTSSPTPDVHISPQNPYIDSGERITFTAWGGDGHYEWEADAGSPSEGTGSTFSTRFYNRSSSTVYHDVIVTSDGRSARAWVGVNPEDDDDELSCEPDQDTVSSGQSVKFHAFGDGLYFDWSAPKGNPSSGWGTPFTTRFYNSSGYTRTYTVTVSTEDDSASCSVSVRSEDDDEDDDDISVDVDHSVRNVTRGGEGSNVSAYVGDTLRFTVTITPEDGDLEDARIEDSLPRRLSYVDDSTYVNGSRKSDGIAADGIPLGTLREDRTYTVRFDATVDSGAYGWVSNEIRVDADNLATQTRTTTISLNGSIWTPVPTYTPWPTPWPTWTPAPAPATAMTVTHTGRNISRGQAGEFKSVRATGGETLDLIIQVTNPTDRTLYNVRLIESLPEGMNAIAGTTSVDGAQATDGIAASGISLGSLAPHTTKVVKVSVVVDGATVPTRGQVTTSVQARVSADGMSVRNVSMDVFLGSAPVGGNAGAIPTGPMDSVVLALLIAIVVTGAYAMYARTDLFGRRLALAQLAGRIGAPLNFHR